MASSKHSCHRFDFYGERAMEKNPGLVEEWDFPQEQQPSKCVDPPLTINYTIPWPLATINHMTTAARLNL